MDTYFIVNPAAGRGKALELLPEIEGEMQRRRLPYEIYLTKGRGDGEDFVRKLTAAHPERLRIFACGGDGTLHETINGAIGKNVEIGLFPVGTGNDFVRNFTEKEKFLSLGAQLEGTAKKLDLLRVSGRYCVNMVNIGFDCEVVAKAAQWKKRPLVHGPMAYFLAVGSLFFRPMGKTLAFRREGEEKQGKYLLCTFANGSFCGGAFCSSPYARLDDGKMDAAFIGKVSRGEFLRLLPAYRKGAYLEKMAGRKELEYFTCDQLELLAKRPQKVSLDGEIYHFRHLRLKMEKEAWTFLVPAGSQLMEKDRKEET
ncbi:hypothetical protein H9X85_03190 [Anaerotignum lactatifermentans]|uniref:DAGKc domain-containing protein n=1 Tax=Anaerotignum lactatifermentans TaxID=160404 RepID=A0ABS2GAP0_9FIRM|nr:diacylglycerol kinase family protein [Anaerotignum lactatifermentans]MBM6828638.1 hypothetical protein [Anaerotignum lactatifermentans]MBM6878556.1 hypothetical protein [Anaerotignum lactatifermentans]MBM6950220.1 hypothetical protein [Anaerotignum lactatifermentans]